MITTLDTSQLRDFLPSRSSSPLDFLAFVFRPIHCLLQSIPITIGLLLNCAGCFRPVGRRNVPFERKARHALVTPVKATSLGLGVGPVREEEEEERPEGEKDRPQYVPDLREGGTKHMDC